MQHDQQFVLWHFDYCIVVIQQSLTLTFMNHVHSTVIPVWWWSLVNVTVMINRSTAFPLTLNVKQMYRHHLQHFLNVINHHDYTVMSELTALTQYSSVIVNYWCDISTVLSCLCHCRHDGNSDTLFTLCCSHCVTVVVVHHFHDVNAVEQLYYCTVQSSTGTKSSVMLHICSDVVCTHTCLYSTVQMMHSTTLTC